MKTIRFIKTLFLVLKLGPERILEFQREAKTDPLTGLLNRRGFFEKLEIEKARSDRYGHQFLIAYLDIDDLKKTNDTQGHEEGDKVLVSLATTIKRSCRQSDFAARIGGDEFVIVFVEVKGFGDEISKRLSAEAENVSIGFYYYQPPLVSINDIVRFAETEMRKEKKRRKVSR